MDGIVTGKVEKSVGSIPTTSDFHTVTISRFMSQSVNWSKARIAVMFHGTSGKTVYEYLFFPQDNYFVYMWGHQAVDNDVTITELPEDESTTFELSDGSYTDTFTWNRTTKVLTNTKLSGQFQFRYW